MGSSVAAGTAVIREGRGEAAVPPMKPPDPSQLLGGVPGIAPDAQPGKPRVEWVDYAKGICIFFVVMLHVNDLVQERAHAVGWLEAVVTFARPFRMPDCFLIAGLFLAGAMRRPWRRYLDAKVVHFLYFYLLWMTLQFAVMTLPHLLGEGAGALEIAAATSGAGSIRWARCGSSICCRCSSS
jgi:hypothetical protein